MDRRAALARAAREDFCRRGGGRARRRGADRSRDRSHVRAIGHGAAAGGAAFGGEPRARGRPALQGGGAGSGHSHRHLDQPARARARSAAGDARTGSYGMSISNETLMAYVDSELDAAARAEVEAAMRRDPEIEQRLAEYRGLRAKLKAAYEPALADPVPARLRAILRADNAGGTAAAGGPRRAPQEL